MKPKKVPAVSCLYSPRGRPAAERAFGKEENRRAETPYKKARLLYRRACNGSKRAIPDVFPWSAGS